MTNWTPKDWASLAATFLLWLAAGYGLIRGFRNGRLWSRSGIVSRAADPSGFWMLMIIYTVPYVFVSIAVAVGVVRAALGMPP